MTNNSIFELSDKLGYTSPFGDWVKEEADAREKRNKVVLKKQITALPKKFKLFQRGTGYDDFIKMINETWFPTNWVQVKLDPDNFLDLKVEPAKYGAAKWIPQFLNGEMDKTKFDLFFGTAQTEGVMKKLGKCTSEEIALAKYLYTEVIFHSMDTSATVDATLDDAIDAKIDSFPDARIFMKQLKAIKFNPADQLIENLLKKMFLLHFIEEQRYAQINLRLKREEKGLEDIGTNDYIKSHLSAINKTAELIDTTYDADAKSVEIPDANANPLRLNRFLKLPFDLINKSNKPKFTYLIEIKYERIFNSSDLTIEMRLVECFKTSKQ